MKASPNTSLKKQIPSSQIPSSSSRYQQSVQFLQAIQQVVPGHAEIGAIVTAGQNVGSEGVARLKGASEVVAAATKAFSEKSDGKNLAGINRYVQQWLAQKKGEPKTYTP